MVLQQPAPFLNVRVYDLSAQPSIIGLCVGYELGEWRNSQFADHLMEWLPEFSLTHSEVESLHSGNMVALIREAAKKVYKSQKFQSRGEFGELILHAAIRQVFGSLPAISKIYYKTARNDTVKGFDAVHVVAGQDGLELWLGEAKFYQRISAAIKDVVVELQQHFGRDYLRDEFLLLTGKIDSNWPHADELKKLLSPNTSLDEVFKRVCIPVLLTYDSKCIAGHTECNEGYVKDFVAEVEKVYQEFASNKLPPVVIHLFLLPLHYKKELIAELDKKLKGWQTI